jgi:hypothetical protein
MTILQVKNAEVVEKAKELFAIVEKRRELEKNEKYLKEYFKEIIGDDSGVRVGPYLVTLTPKSRTGIDRDILIERFGLAAVKEFEKKIPYSEVNITETASS